MTLRYQTWRRFTRVGSILALPVVLFLFVHPSWGAWSHRLEIAAYIFLFSLGGTGALLAILTRTGIVRMIYSDSDKQSMHYKMSRNIAENEQDAQFKFSDSYYEGLDVKPPGPSESGKKPPA
jgi:hypothetical protein